MRPKRRREHQRQTPSRRVAVLVDTSTDWSRRIISGIINYLKVNDPWHLFIEPHGVGEHLELQKGWQGDGVISRITSEKMATSLNARNIPVVNVSGMKVAGPQFPQVTSDMAIAARMAADYFLERGFKHFAYFSLQGLEYVARQRDAFDAAVRQAGHKCHFHSVKAHLGAQVPDWNIRVESLASWLSSLPKPLAVFTWSGGRELIHACQFAELRIPEEIALLSGTDDLLCEASHIPISAIRASSERIGFEAAAMLDELMRGKTVKAPTKLIPPMRVISRQSTEIFSIQDSAIVKALRFIHANAQRPIHVDEVAACASIHRRMLERRFKDILGRSPAEHIRRAHIEIAKKLLVDTNQSVADIAEKSGFGSAEYMASLFHDELGTTPLRYRREAALGLS